MRKLLGLLRFALVGVGIGIIGYGLTLSVIGSQGRWLLCLGSGGFLIALGLWPTAHPDEAEESRPTVNVFAAIVFIFGLLALQMARMQIFSSKSLAERTGIDPFSGDVLSNPRAVNGALLIERGTIFDRNGVVLAESAKRRGIFDRRYPNPNASYVCGYFSPLKYGTTGIEEAYDDQLSGRELVNPIQDEVDKLLGRTPEGADIRLTINADLQETAHRMLGDSIGAVVLIEVATGAIRALASNPHLDPNKLVAIDLDSATAATAYWAQLNSDPQQPLLVRATDGLYTPGSTFKTVTASAAIDSGTAGPTDVFIDNGQLDVDGHIIVEENRPDDSIDQWTLSEGLAFSLNVVFARVGLELGPDRLRIYAERFGFGEPIPFDVPVVTGQISASPDFLQNPAALADTSFGQGELLTSPIGMALVAATLANGGTMMRPYLVEAVIDRDGMEIETTEPRLLRNVVDAATANTMQEMMVNAVESGYATNAAIDGLRVGGKTGTAETGSDMPHSWFIGFAGEKEPEYAVAVVFEFGGISSQGPIATARQILLEAISAD